MPQGFEQPPVAPLVGIGQSGTGNPAANPNVVELGALRVQTGHQIAQPFASGELRVHHAQQMAPSREVLDAAVRCEPIDQILEVTERDKVQQLRENRPSAIHGAASFARKTGNDTALQQLAISNRRNRASRQSPRHCWISQSRHQYLPDRCGCDYLVVLLSEDSIDSEMVQGEIRLARHYRRDDGSPSHLSGSHPLRGRARLRADLLHRPPAAHPLEGPRRRLDGGQRDPGGGARGRRGQRRRLPPPLRSTPL